MMVSPDEASAMACLMVLQAVVGDVQLLLLLPLTPFTYHVVPAKAVGTAANNISATTHIRLLDFIVPPVKSKDFEPGHERRTHISHYLRGPRMRHATLFVNVKLLHGHRHL